MKVAVTIDGHIPSQYAHSINTVKHAYAFSQLGYEVEILSVLRYKEQQSLKTISNIYEWYGIQEVPIKYFKDKSLFFFQEVPIVGKILRGVNKLFQGKLKNIFDPEKEISDYIKKNNFDICFSRSYRIVAYNVHNKIPTIIESHSANPFLSIEIKNLIEYAKNSYFKGIVTIHQKLKDNFLTMGMPENKVLIYEDALDLKLLDSVEDDIEKNRQKLNLPQNKTIVLYSGSLKSGKGIHIILDIAKKYETNQNIEFVLVGGSFLEVSNWKKYYSGKNVIFTGFVSGKSVPIYLKSADILIMPYDNNDKKMVMDLETTSPIKLFEYMGAKRPIISTDIQVISKVLEDKKEILLANRFDEYIKYIELLINDKKYGQYLANNAYNQTQQYTYETRCKNMLKYFKVK